MNENDLNPTLVKPAMAKKAGPVCPHCNVQPCTVGMSVISFGSAMAAMFVCSACEKILSIGPLPDAQLPPQQGSRILIPGSPM
jgi:hypothetical protein